MTTRLHMDNGLRRSRARIPGFRLNADERRRCASFTIIELLAASTILLIVVTLALYGFMYALKENARAMVQNELDMDVQGSMELLKRDLRLSALDKMFFYPLASGSYSAVSFPIAYPNTNGGTVEIGTNGKIIWDETVIFHVWKTTPNQLRCTRFKPRSILTDAQMQEQLTYVATNGSATNTTGGGTFNWTNAQTTVVFENLFDWSVTPQAGVYDGYDSVTNRDEAANLGSCILSNGIHTFTFTAVGSNTSSKGYNIGLDELTVSPNGMGREAELQLPAGSANPTNMLMKDIGSWSHNRQLYFRASTNNSSFTIVMTNDCWEVSTFRGTGQIMDDTKVLWDAGTMDYLVSLDGNLGEVDAYGWYAKKQTATTYTNVADVTGFLDSQPTLQDCAVRVLLRGSEMASGNFIPYNSAKTNVVYFYSGAGFLGISEAYIAEAADSTNIAPDAVGSFAALGGALIQASSPSDPHYWAAGTAFYIDKNKSYLVTFRVPNMNWMSYGRYWLEQNDPSGRGCWILPGASSADAQAANWSANTNVFATNRLYAVGVLYESWPTNGYLTSQVCDTKKTAVGDCTVSWLISTNAPCNDGGLAGAFALQVRAGNSNNCSDAVAWSSVAELTSSGGTINLGANRYVQFRARLGTCSSGIHAIRLHQVNMTWAGETRYVDIGGTFTKGPDYGIWELKVDGRRLVRGIAVNIEIYQDVFSVRGARRITSELTSEVTPRNTGR